MAKKASKQAPDPGGRPLAPAPAQIDIAFIASGAEFGRAIEQARLYRGLSQVQVAAAARVNRRFIGALENGKPGVQLQKALAVMVCVGLMSVVVPMEAVQGA